MKLSFRIFLVLAVLCCAHLAVAQTQPASQPGFLVVHQNKVPMKDLARVNALNDSVFKPVLDQLVKDGKLMGWGEARHAWGDEWNVNYYFISENHRSFLDLWAEFGARLNKQFPEASAEFFSYVQEHKDNMYAFRYASPQNGVPQFLVFHRNKVLMKDVARANELQDAIVRPVLDEMVKEGRLVSWGQLNHGWGDEWNYNFYYTAASHRAFLDAWDEVFARVNKRSPNWAKDLLPLFQEHKDDMYIIRRTP